MMTYELQLIIQLVHSKIDKSVIEQIGDTHTNVKDWDRFVKLVIRHRLVNVVYTQLKAYGLSLPENAASLLNRQFELERKKNFILVASLVKLNESLTKNVRILWFKGPVQSQRMYQDNFLRSYADLDLFIDKSDLKQVDRLLRDAGYFPLMDWTQFSASHFSKYSEFIKEMAYIHEKTNVCIDVHWNLVMSKELMPFSFHELYERGSVVNIHNTSFRTLNELDNFVYINIHGCFDHWKSLSQLIDVTFTLQKDPKLKGEFEHYLNTNNLHHTLNLGIGLSDFIFKQDQNTVYRFNDFIQFFERTSFENESGKLNRLDFFKRQWNYSNTLNYKLNCFESNFFYGDNNDLWRLPRPLFFLYYISVPFRWIGRKIRTKK